jgi:hypothetical protein
MATERWSAESIARLPRAKALRVLTLSQWADDAIELLIATPPTQLRELNLWCMPTLPPALLGRLKAKLPHTKVEWRKF